MRKTLISMGIFIAFASSAMAMDTSAFTPGGYATPQSIDAYVNPILEKAQEDLNEIRNEYANKVETFNKDGDNDDDAGHLHPENNKWKPSKFNKAVRDKFISDKTKAGFKQADPQTSFNPQNVSDYAKKISGITNIRNYDKEIDYLVNLIEDLGSKCDVKSDYLKILNKLWDVAKEVHKAHFAATYAVTQEIGYKNFLGKTKALVINKGNELFTAANSAVAAKELEHEPDLRAEVNAAVNSCLASCSIPCHCPPPPAPAESGSGSTGSGSGSGG